VYRNGTFCYYKLKWQEKCSIFIKNVLLRLFFLHVLIEDKVRMQDVNILIDIVIEEKDNLIDCEEFLAKTAVVNISLSQQKYKRIMHKTYGVFTCF